MDTSEKSTEVPHKEAKGGTSETTVILHLELDQPQNKIPTTLVPLAPDVLRIDSDEVDMLSGVFHIMWSDMPRPRTYRLRLTDMFSADGGHAGSWLECDGARKFEC